VDPEPKSVETRLRTYIDERIETTETQWLTAFHNWARTFEVRARGTSAAVREFEERLGWSKSEWRSWVIGGKLVSAWLDRSAPKHVKIRQGTAVSLTDEQALDDGTVPGG
jgi:hypothetical protein